MSKVTLENGEFRKACLRADIRHAHVVGTSIEVRELEERLRVLQFAIFDLQHHPEGINNDTIGDK